MKAALFYGNKRDIRIEERPLPPLARGEILLKIEACGICGSDARSYFNGIEERYKIPIILGHEISATINDTGGGVKGYGVGERVTVAPIYGCGQCEFCISGKENLCNEVVVFGCTMDGGFAEYMLVPQKAVERGVLVKLPVSVSNAAGTLIEVFSCCLHGQRRAGIHPSDSVVIFGAGPIGLAHLTIAKKIGAGVVGVVDLVPSRLEEATKFGADFVVNATETDWVSKVKNAIGTGGCEIAITAAPSVNSIEYALKIIKKGGIILVFGGLPHGSQLNLDPNLIHYQEVTITGSIDATIDDFNRAVRMAPSFNLERFVTHRFPLSAIHEAMAVMERKQGLKVIFDLELLSAKY